MTPDWPTLQLPWIPAWGVRLHFGVDGLSFAYGLLTVAIAAVVLAYAVPYMRHHVESQRQPASALLSFFLLFGLFIVAMVGLVTSLDLLQLFVFWDITAICSYLLIAFDRHEEEARRSALMALLVTGISSIPLLVAALVLLAEYGTTSIPRLLAVATPSAPAQWAAALMIVSAIGKSAQWPLHFWLPRAMAAPTPVSAYLHAAAMVAAGVFLLQRIQPLVELHPPLPLALQALGWISMAAGGILALREDEMKRVLAYSTMAQYGHVVFLVGLGGPHGAAAAAFFVLAHGLCKSALFLSAGAVTVATGEKALSKVGGLRRDLPWLAAAAGVAAAGLAGVPLTIGFFKDELLFATAHEHGWITLAMAVSGPSLTLAYMWRFWSGIFLGRRRAGVEHRSPLLVWPIALLAASVLLLGVYPSPATELARQAAAATAGPAEIATSYHLDARIENLAALAAVATALLLMRARRTRFARRLSAAAAAAGPERVYHAAAGALRRLGAAGRRRSPAQLRERLVLVFMAAAALVVGGQISVGIGAPKLELTWGDMPLVAALALTAAAAVGVVIERKQLTMTLALSVTSIALAAVFALAGAPDVALVLVIINVISTLLLVALLQRLPDSALREQQVAPSLAGWRGQDVAFAAVGGLLAFLVTWGTLSHPEPASWLGRLHLEAAERAHAHNAVTAILADFRGLDTLGEITVVAISVLAVDLLMRGDGGRR